MGMEMKLELVRVPVADIDGAKNFYVERLGFNLAVGVSELVVAKEE
jgi:catechol 2,3-dioxygenase-like lactoylglutathione lyase family enzyme